MKPIRIMIKQENYSNNKVVVKRMEVLFVTLLIRPSSMTDLLMFLNSS